MRGLPPHGTLVVIPFEGIVDFMERSEHECDATEKEQGEECPEIDATQMFAPSGQHRLLIGQHPLLVFISLSNRLPG